MNIFNFIVESTANLIACLLYFIQNFLEVLMDFFQDVQSAIFLGIEVDMHDILK